MAVADGGLVQNGSDSRARRRRLRFTLISVSVLVVLFVAATGGIGYYFSGVLLNVDNSVSYPVEVKAVDGGQVTLSRTSDTERAVVEGLWWDGGEALLSNAVTIRDDSVVRTVTSILHGSL